MIIGKIVHDEDHRVEGVYEEEADEYQVLKIGFENVPLRYSRLREMTNLNPHPPHPPHLVSSFGLWHDPNKIDPHHIRVDFVFMYVHEGGSLQCPSLHHTEGIERMPMGLISTIAYLYKYKKIAISCNNVDLSSLDLIIAIYYLESLLTEISYCDILSGISDGASRR